MNGRTYVLGFKANRVVFKADEPFTGEMKKTCSLYRDGLTFDIDREGEQVSVRVFSTNGSWKKQIEEFRQVAFAFYGLAHSDSTLFNELPDHLLHTDEGRACQRYVESGNRDDLETAGRVITGTRHWYTYIGRRW